MEIINILKKKLQTAERIGSKTISISPTDISDIFDLIRKKDEEIIKLQKQIINSKNEVIDVKINPTFK